jgi:membrane peptidoglycan carboxypeptidase
MVYGKTGTTAHNHDALFVGMTDDYVGAFWVGHDNNRAMDGIYGGGPPAHAFRWVTNAYYTTKLRSDERSPSLSEAPSWWQVWTPDVLQNRRLRYYVLLASYLLLAAFIAGGGMKLLRMRALRRGFGLVPLLRRSYHAIATPMRRLVPVRLRRR